MEQKLDKKVQEENMKTAFATSDFYQLLSLSLQSPSKELANVLLDGSYKHDGLTILEELSCSQEDLSQINEAFDKLIATSADETVLLQEMSQELTNLFYHPKKPSLSIYETLFLSDPSKDDMGTMLFLSPAALDAERCYKEAGVSLINRSGEPADHIVTELEFMMYLYGSQGKALQEHNQDVLVKIERQIEQFEQMHIGKWSYDFFDLLETTSTSAAYKVIAQLAKIGLRQVLLKAKTS